MSEIRYKGKIFSGAAAYGGADDVSYDNTTSHLTATNVQDALDEVGSVIPFINDMPSGVCMLRANISAATVFNFPNNSRCRLFVITSNPDRCGEYIVFTTGAGVLSTKAVLAASDITFDTSTNNKLKITPNTGARDLLFLSFGVGDQRITQG